MTPHVLQHARTELQSMRTPEIAISEFDLVLLKSPLHVTEAFRHGAAPQLDDPLLEHFTLLFYPGRSPGSAAVGSGYAARNGLRSRPRHGVGEGAGHDPRWNCDHSDTDTGDDAGQP